MNPITPSSAFIPKRPLTRAEAPRPRPISLFLVVSLLVLVLVLVFFAGTYAWQGILDNDINRPCQELSGGDARTRRCGLVATVELEEQNIDRDTILLLQRLDYKLAQAEELLDQHQTIIPVFELLEELTLTTVRYTKMSHTETSINLDGQASSYEDIAVQSEVFAQHKGRISSFIFSDFNLDSILV